MNLKHAIVLLLAGSSTAAVAQRMATKTNILFGPFVKSVRTIQEIKTGPRFTTQTTVKVRPGGVMNLEKTGSVYIFDQQFKAASLPRGGGGGNVTEFRIYSKKKGAMRGFYFGPYASYSFIQMKSGEIPVEFMYNNATQRAVMVQTVKAYIVGGGFQMGVQGMIGNRVPVDWTIMGIGMGSLGLKGTIEAFNTSEGFDFRNYMSDDQGNVKFGLERIFSVRKQVESTLISFDRKLPFPMIRTSLSIGFAYGMKPKMPKMGKGDSPTPGGTSDLKQGTTPDPNSMKPDQKELEQKMKDQAPDQKEMEQKIKDQVPNPSDSSKVDPKKLEQDREKLDQERLQLEKDKQQFEKEKLEADRKKLEEEQKKLEEDKKKFEEEKKKKDPK